VDSVVHRRVILLSLECIEARADGRTDPAFQFSNQDLVAVVGDPADGDCVKMTLTANLKDGSTSIREDVVVIIKNRD